MARQPIRCRVPRSTTGGQGDKPAAGAESSASQPACKAKGLLTTEGHAIHLLFSPRAERCRASAMTVMPVETDEHGPIITFIVEEVPEGHLLVLSLLGWSWIENGGQHGHVRSLNGVASTSKGHWSPHEESRSPMFAMAPMMHTRESDDALLCASTKSLLIDVPRRTPDGNRCGPDRRDELIRRPVRCTTSSPSSGNEVEDRRTSQ